MNNETKYILLNVTRDLIDNKGIESISMREVGRLAGLSRSALYRHFDNKESLLAAIVVENFSMLGEMINELEGTVNNSKQLLFQVFVTYYDFAIGNSGHYKLMFSTQWDETKYPEIQQAALYVFQKASYFVSEALPGTSKKSNSKISIEKTAILYAFIHGLVELHLNGHTEMSKGLDDAKVLINHMVDAILEF